MGVGFSPATNGKASFHLKIEGWAKLIVAILSISMTLGSLVWAGTQFAVDNLVSNRVAPVQRDVSELAVDLELEKARLSEHVRQAERTDDLLLEEMRANRARLDRILERLGER